MTTTSQRRGGFALPFVVVMILLLALMTAGSLATVTSMQRSGTLRGGDLQLGASAIDAAARALAACPSSTWTLTPGQSQSIALADGPVGPVSASVTRLTARYAIISGSVVDSRAWSPSRGARRRFRLTVALPDSAALAANPAVGCGAVLRVWRWGLDW